MAAGAGRGETVIAPSFRAWESAVRSYQTLGRTEMGSVGRGDSTTLKRLMESITTFLEPVPTSLLKTATLQNHSTQCGCITAGAVGARCTPAPAPSASTSPVRRRSPSPATRSTRAESA